MRETVPVKPLSVVKHQCDFLLQKNYPDVSAITPASGLVYFVFRFFNAATLSRYDHR